MKKDDILIDIGYLCHRNSQRLRNSKFDWMRMKNNRILGPWWMKVEQIDKNQCTMFGGIYNTRIAYRLGGWYVYMEGCLRCDLAKTIKVLHLNFAITYAGRYIRGGLHSLKPVYFLNFRFFLSSSKLIFPFIFG